MIYVLIEREIALDLESTYEEAARRLLTNAYQTTGFVDGHTYTEMGNPLRRFTMSRWKSILHWQHWYDSEERRDQMAQLAPMLAHEEKITILEDASTVASGQPRPASVVTG
ncbi:antibiotic biosynthesis monooxygenase family protein [Microbulbifer agarilyticus]|uniref:Antibiotic biosynthesis monooxygenase n=1 Tax=Microbulbifer agarilyticus TaxID=260552 RepID=A0A1Q2M3K1_9GAMM|nr:antibiotic biosynthesis monooxygenase [Microbulbifer agarilyticus]AQQ67303.1 antibiotic biosynthesis monooxygenase [Microbulbifer agarilyticus]